MASNRAEALVGQRRQGGEATIPRAFAIGVSSAFWWLLLGACAPCRGQDVLPTEDEALTEFKLALSLAGAAEDPQHRAVMLGIAMCLRWVAGVSETLDYPEGRQSCAA